MCSSCDILIGGAVHDSKVYSCYCCCCCCCGLYCVNRESFRLMCLARGCACVRSFVRGHISVRRLCVIIAGGFKPVRGNRRPAGQYSRTYAQIFGWLVRCLTGPIVAVSRSRHVLAKLVVVCNCSLDKGRYTVTLVAAVVVVVATTTTWRGYSIHSSWVCNDFRKQAFL